MTENGDALHEILVSAQQGDAGAQFNLGEMFRQGRGVEQSDEQAGYWYQLAADQGDADAQFCLGILHVDGKIPGDDFEAGLLYLIFAAEQGHHAAKRSLGEFFYEGRDSIGQDPIAAYALMAEAAEGNESAVDRLPVYEAALTRKQLEEACHLDVDGLLKSMKSRCLSA